MPTNYTTLLGFALPTTGELTNTWGTVVNNSITELVEDSIAATATASVTSGDWTLSDTGSGVANEARCAILIPTGTPGVSRNILAPNKSKAYFVINQSDSSVVIKGVTGPTTGVTLAAGSRSIVAWNGSDFVQIGGDVTLNGAQTLTNKTLTSPTINSGTLNSPTLVTPALGTPTSGNLSNCTNIPSSGLTGTVDETNGGTGNNTYTTGDLLYASGSTTLSKLNIGTSGQVLSVSGGLPAWTSAAPGGVTSVTASTPVSSSGGTTPNISLGTVGIGNGGTNITTYATGDILYASASNTLAKLSIGTSGQVLTVSGGGIPTWATGGGSGTVTSVTGTGSVNGITLSGTVTTSGSLTLGGSLSNVSLTSQVTGTLPIGNGGTGATTDSGARSNLGLGSIATQNSNNVSISGGSISGTTVSGYAATGSSNTFTANQTISTGGTSRLFLAGSTYGIQSDNSNLLVGQLAGTYLDIQTARFRINYDSPDKPTAGQWGGYSDQRLKTDITSYTKGLAAVCSLRPVNYRFNDVTDLGKQTNYKLYAGLIAQEVEQTVLANMITEKEDGYKQLDPSELTYTMINAIKELSAQVDALKAEVAALKGA